ncbi:hypothetical protein EJ110_NYTH12394 [Nymphaea thermarum]|nr:hypothetical protein EJ110_NYTH12394 [Nymphaea thermarum]
MFVSFKLIGGVSKGTDEKCKRWHYTTYNFTIQALWSEFLVNGKKHGPGNTGVSSGYLDDPGERWVHKLQEFHYAINSAGHWFLRPGSKLSADRSSAARPAINGMKNFKGITNLRTSAPSHFENGTWNK